MRGTQDAGIRVASRISRASYGLCYNVRWRDGQGYRPADRAICPIRGIEIAKNQVDWILRRVCFRLRPPPPDALTASRGRTLRKRAPRD